MTDWARSWTSTAGRRRNWSARRPAHAAWLIALEDCSIAALARDHGVSRGAIRTAVADLLPDHTATAENAPAPELPVTLDMPGKIADYLHTTELELTERAALDQGMTVRRGQGYTLRVSAVPAVHTSSSSPPASRSTAPSSATRADSLASFTSNGSDCPSVRAPVGCRR
ncbi:hypothetical protein SUDANB99_05926 (plasmid) [Streptomyces sp. enrichment culture]